uniref:Aminopeptidase N-like N-terminal domain-containing protein n=1 Tax=Anopheles stephensi TaxID=30069 RepID=A0A182YTI1_ANOST
MDLKIGTATVTFSEQTLTAQDIQFDADQETACFVFGSEIPAGAAKLTVKFSGELNDKMKGFYRSKYFSATGEERYAGVTQFEATDARRCFPCWDEPAIKATFDISLDVPQNLVALSNMPVLEQKPNATDSTVLVTFDRTP